jgi:protein-S-isoprenylcysteine O-methyltransferase Ste14
MKLFLQAFIKLLLGAIIVGALLFLSAGTFRWNNAWLLMAILFLPMLLVGLIMLIKAPNLLKSRLNAKEKDKTQSTIVKLSGCMFLVGFIVAGLGVRFGYYTLPTWAVYIAAAVFLCAYVLYAVVLRQKAFLSRTIQVQENQTVVTTGLYGIVRHPMYSATLLLFLSMPLVLGSVYAFAIFLAYPVIIAVRIKKEESFLEKELPGYSDYKKKVKYRLIPFLW